jgi:hypothetical protein
MSARRIIEGAAFGPVVLKVAMQAFDEAWSSVAGRFGPDEHDSARQALAESVIAATREDSADVPRLRDAGIRAMQIKFPSRFGAKPPQSGQGTKIG